MRTSSRPQFRLVVILFALMAGLFLTPAIQAGPNSDGFLILHANPSLAFTTDPPWAGSSELRDCKDAITQVSGNGEGVHLFVLAAFSDFASPQLRGIGFGIEYTSNQIDLVGRHVGNATELTTTGWPRSGTGTSVILGETVTDRLVELYWFAAYAINGNTIQLTHHPDSDKDGFADASIPSEIDEPQGYGKIGFGTKGFNPCASEEDATGACCDPDGPCSIQTRTSCEFTGYGYTFLGDGTSCQPNRCVPGQGACCIGVDCYLLDWNDCVSSGGIFQGQGATCEPTPCNFSTVTSTWGKLKSKFR